MEESIVRPLLLACALTLALSVNVAAQSLRVTDSGLHYSFVVPGGWERVSPETEADIRRNAADASARAGLEPANTPYVDAAFRRSGTGLDASFFMVQHQPRPGTTLRELAEETAREYTGKVVDLPTTMGLAQIGPDVTIDRRRGLVLMPMAVSVGDKKVRNFEVIKPGRSVVLSVVFIAVSEQFAASREFDAILESLRFDTGYEAISDPRK
jgi:hypothetical protein